MREESKLKAGILILSSLIVLTGLSLFLQRFSFNAKRFGILFNRVVMKLDKGSEVYVQDVKRGRVMKVEVTPQSKVLVWIEIDKGTPVFVNSTFTIASGTLIAQPAIAITNHPPLEKLVSNGQIISGPMVKDPPRLEDIMGGVQTMMPDFQNTVSDLRRVVGSASEMLTDPEVKQALKATSLNLAEISSAVRDLAQDPNILNPIRETAQQVEQATRHINRAANAIADLASEPALMNSLHRTIENTEQLTTQLNSSLPKTLQSIEKTAESMQNLFGNSEVTASLHRTTKYIESATKSLDRLVSNEELANQLTSTVASFELASRQLAALTTDTDLQVNIKDTFDNAKQLTSEGTQALSELRLILAKTLTTIDKIGGTLAETTENLRKTSQDAAEISEFVKLSGIKENVAAGIGELRESASLIKAASQNVNNLIDESKQDIRDTIHNIKDLTESAKPLLQKGSEILEKAEGPLEEIRSLRLVPEASLWYIPERRAAFSEINATLSLRSGFLTFGAYDISRSGQLNLQIGKKIGRQMAVRAGVYRNEPGIGTDLRLGSALLSLNAFRPKDLDVNAWLQWPLSRKMRVRVGGESIIDNPLLAFGLELGGSIGQ